MLWQAFRNFQINRAAARAERDLLAQVKARWEDPPATSQHGLGAEVIVSLTSHAKRFPTLINTLRCLLAQTVQPDRVILWLAPADEQLLPDAVRDVIGTRAFEIRITPDSGSYKKLIPALAQFPSAYIATADDDVFYPANWLEGLIAACSPLQRQIVCYRAHGMTFRHGVPEAYGQWDYEANAFDGTVLVPTGVAGILYAPHALPATAGDAETFMAICPKADDIWFAWMGHLAGSEYVKIGKSHTPHSWRGSQKTGLHVHNVMGGGNDRQIAAMVARFGTIRQGRYVIR